MIEYLTNFLCYLDINNYSLIIFIQLLLILIIEPPLFHCLHSEMRISEIEMELAIKRTYSTYVDSSFAAIGSKIVCLFQKCRESVVVEQVIH